MRTLRERCGAILSGMMTARYQSGSTALLALASAGEERPRRTARYLQLCQTTRTLVTLDDGHASVQAITIGDGWLLARHRGSDLWIDLSEAGRQWESAGREMRLRLVDERTLVMEENSEAHWLSASGASLTIACEGLESQRRGWRNLQLRAAKRSERDLLDVPYLVPAYTPGQVGADIVFLSPVYFSERMRIRDVVRRSGRRASLTDALPLLAAGLAASATLSALQTGRPRDLELRRQALSVAASDAAAVASVVSALLLLEVYADSLSKMGTSFLQKSQRSHL